jgi:predicted ribosome quality control (RQC) complex YloA/Tae2 family protein
MYFDAFTISSLVDEFTEKLVGGKVQDSIDVDPTGFGFEIYANHQRHYLYASANQQIPRVHLVGDKLRRGLYTPKQLGLLFRRYVEGAILMKVSQPEWERVLFFDFEHSLEGETRIVIEPMERRANILLLKNGVILDCINRVGKEDNRYRQSLPNYDYQMPPPLEGRFNPFEITLQDIEAIFDSSENPDKDKLARLFPRKMLGFSPLMAREIVFRAMGDADVSVADSDPDSLYFSMMEFFEPLKKREWQAGVAGDDMIEAFSVYPLRHLPNWQAMESTSAAITEYYGAAVGEEAYDQAKKPVREALEEAKIRFSKKVESMESGIKDQSELEHLQHSGELLLAYQYRLEKGQTELRAQYNADEPELVIKIDPDLTPLENAQRYFDKYNRAKRAQQNVPELMEEAKNELDFILQLENDLEMASNWPEIDDVIQELQKRGFDVRGKKIKRMGGGSRTGPLKLTKEGYIIWVGRNSRQNDEVTFRKANSDDFWLHARDVPGSHVVIRNDGRHIPDELIEAAASIAAYYSPRRKDSKVDVILTRCKYVKPIKNAGPGMVTFRNERTVTVSPHSEEILEGN